MDIDKRYAGRGHPISHWHYGDWEKDGRRYDVLLFESGEYAVWNADTEDCLSFWPSQPQAEQEAKRLLGKKR